MISASNRVNRIGLCILSALLLSACSSFSFNYKTNKSKDRASERHLATLSLQEEALGPARHIHAYKVHKGYALKTPITRSKQSKSDVVLIKNKEYDYFAGMQWSWKF